jgi:hypothetical protein
MRIENAAVLLAIVARPAPNTAPTFPAGVDILCPTQSVDISTEIQKRETPQGCGGTVQSFGAATGTIRVEKLTIGNSWNIETSGGATPEGMAIRLQVKVGATASAYDVYEGIIERWNGVLSTQNDTVETVEIALISNWLTGYGG